LIHFYKRENKEDIEEVDSLSVNHNESGRSA